MAAHWYSAEGNLYGQVPTQKGGYRDFDLRDARKNGALPSVTTILGLLAKPGLVKWQVEQGIKAALSFAGFPFEWADVPDLERPTIIAEAYQKSQEYTRYTQDFGVATHWWVNKKLRAVETNEIPPMIAGSEEVADGLVEWFPQYGFTWDYTEKSFANLEMGIAGSVDLLGWRLENRLAIGDGKTQEPPLTTYLEHALQLAGYSLGLGLDSDVERWSFIMNRLVPGEVKAVLWQDKDKSIEETNAKYDQMFLLLRDFWFLSNNYDPRDVSND